MMTRAQTTEIDPISHFLLNARFFFDMEDFDGADDGADKAAARFEGAARSR